MTRLDRLFFPLLFPALIAVSAGCGDDDDDGTTDPMTGMDAGTGGGTDASGTGSDASTGSDAGTIVEVAQEAGLTELLNAATAAGLADTLNDNGPFTVFAPTDEAFVDLSTIFTSTSTDLLANVLLHHVVPNVQDSSAVVGADSFTTIAGTAIAVDENASPITVGGAPLSNTLDVPASNGIVHVIDAVMIPPTIGEAAAELADLSDLAMVVGSASEVIGEALGGEGPITVFAPVNSAFDNLDLTGLTQEQIDGILTYHVVPGQALSTDLNNDDELFTVNGATLRVSVSPAGDVSLIDAAEQTINVVTPNIRLLNGVVHLIDGVLSPDPQ